MLVTLRQSHAPGERLFIDSSRQTVAVIDAVTGEEHPAQLFVAVLGASNYTFVEATWTQGLADWIGSHGRCLAFLGGVLKLLVPDHLKSAVKSPSFYEPDLNRYRTALRLAKAYGNDRLEAAGQRAARLQAVTYRSLASILKHGLERQTPTPAQAHLPLHHANVCGPDYFH